MTPLSHGFFGYSAGFALAGAAAPFGLSRRLLIFCFSLGALLPDLDAVSLVLNRKIYFGTCWYCHHGFSHSFLGAFLLALMVGAILFLWRKTRRKTGDNPRREFAGIVLALTLGAFLHLPGDMVTLPGIWGGLPLFAPFSWERYGGWALIPWKDFYTIYIASAGYLLLPLLLTLEKRFGFRRVFLTPVVAILFFLGLTLHTANSRFKGYRDWNKQQRELVGETLFNFADRMEKDYIGKLWSVKTLF